MAEVLLERVTKIYEGNTVPTIQDLDLHVEDGEFMVLVGPSGCGKSTTLRMIAGLEQVNGGTIRIGDRVVNRVEPKDRDVAMVFQNYALYPHMTVFENMAFGLKLRKFPKAEIRLRVEETAVLLEIHDVLERKPRSLSGGQRQRVALGRAIVRKPTVFLFDEPLSNLDAKLRVQMRAEIRKLHARLGTTMIYVTHDQVEAMTMGDRITVMNGGVIHQIDSPMNLYHRPADVFVAGFIGSPAMSILPCEVENGNPLRARVGSHALPVPQEFIAKYLLQAGDRVSIGLRPEHVHLDAEACRLPVAVDGICEVAEIPGDEKFLYISLDGGHQIVLRTTDDVLPALRESVRVFLALEKAHVFEVDGGLRRTPAHSSPTPE